MRKTHLASVLLVLLAATLIVASCAQAPTPAAKPTPTPTPTAAPTAKPTTTTSSPTPAAPPKTTAAAPALFAGKTITLIIPQAPGGASDLVGRTYAMFLSKLLPGNPTIIARNMPAAAGIAGANFVYTAKPDGLTLLVSLGSTLLNQLLGLKAVEYDILNMTTFIGSSSGGVYSIKSGIISKPEDLLKAKGIVLGSASGAGSYYTILSKELLNFPTDKVVLAYSGGGEARRAFVSGETNMTYDPNATFITSTSQEIAQGQVMALYQLGRIDEKGDVSKDLGLPADILTIKELYQKLYQKDPSGITWDAYRSLVAAGKTYTYLLIAPPKTPDNIIKAYNDAVTTMAKDPEFSKVIEPLVGKGSKLTAGEAVDKALKAGVVLKPDIRDYLRTTLAKYGVVVQ